MPWCHCIINHLRHHRQAHFGIRQPENVDDTDVGSERFERELQRHYSCHLCGCVCIRTYMYTQTHTHTHTHTSSDTRDVTLPGELRLYIIYTYIYVCVCVYRERERERERSPCQWSSDCTHSTADCQTQPGGED